MQHCEVLWICDTESESPERKHDLITFLWIEFSTKPIPSVLYYIIINGYVVWAFVEPRKIPKKNLNNAIFHWPQKILIYLYSKLQWKLIILLIECKKIVKQIVKILVKQLQLIIEL